MMDAPWIDPGLAWIPGTLFGIIVGLFGGATGVLMSLSRKHQRLIGYGAIKTGYFLLLACSVAMLAVGLLGWLSKQPYGVWYGIGFPGVIGLFVLGSLFPVIFNLPKQIVAAQRNE